MDSSSRICAAQPKEISEALDSSAMAGEGRQEKGAGHGGVLFPDSLLLEISRVARMPSNTLPCLSLFASLTVHAVYRIFNRVIEKEFEFAKELLRMEQQRRMDVVDIGERVLYRAVSAKTLDDSAFASVCDEVRAQKDLYKMNASLYGWMDGNG